MSSLFLLKRKKEQSIIRLQGGKINPITVSISGTNHGFWSHVECSGFRVALEEVTKAKRRYVRFQSGTFNGSHKARTAPRLISSRCLIQMFRRASPTCSHDRPPPPGGILCWLLQARNDLPPVNKHRTSQ